MKIRSGFVSNSSSSSFVLLVNKNSFDEEIGPTLTKSEKGFVDQIFNEANVFGTECYLISGFNTNGGGSWLEYIEFECDLSGDEKDEDDEDYEEQDSAYEVWDALEEKINKLDEKDRFYNKNYDS